MHKKGPCSEVLELYEKNIGFWRAKREAMQQLADFLEGDRYESDTGAFNKDRRQLQIRGQEISDTHRQLVAEATAKPRSIEPRPIDTADDPDMAEVASSLVEHELGQPYKGFEDLYEEALLSAREARLGVVWMDWEPDDGLDGELYFRVVPRNRIMWDPNYRDPHHPRCGWLIEERRESLDWIKANFKGADWVVSDKAATGATGEVKPGVPLMRGNSTAAPVYDDDLATLWFCWYKRDYSTKTREQNDSYQPIEDPGQRYMACQGLITPDGVTPGCGFRTPSQAELIESGKIQTELPEVLEAGCEQCGGNLARVDARSTAEEVFAYPRGKRLCVVAPYAPAPDAEKPLYNGKWPVPAARSFPGLFLTAYVRTGDPVPPCDTDLMWDQQVAADQLRTAAVDRVLEHRNYWIMPRTGMVDFRGQRFEFRDDQFNVMFRDGSTNSMGPQAVELKNGTGLDPAFNVAFGVVQQALTSYRGIDDLGITEENSKNIAASTVAQLDKMKSKATEHFNRRKNRALGKFYGVVWDYIRALYTPGKLARLRLGDVDLIARLEGDDLPNYDFWIEDTPAWTGVEKAKAEAGNALLAIAETKPYLLEIYAEINEFPRSVVRKIQRKLPEIMAAAQQFALMTQMPQPPNKEGSKDAGMVPASQG